MNLSAIAVEVTGEGGRGDRSVGMEGDDRHGMGTLGTRLGTRLWRAGSTTVSAEGFHFQSNSSLVCSSLSFRVPVFVSCDRAD